MIYRSTETGIDLWKSICVIEGMRNLMLGIAIALVGCDLPPASGQPQPQTASGSLPPNETTEASVPIVRPQHDDSKWKAYIHGTFGPRALFEPVFPAIYWMAVREPLSGSMAARGVRVR